MSLAATKHSKRQRKFVNQMRGMGDVPWPARRYRYPATDARLASRRAVLADRCTRPLGERTERHGRLKRKRTVVDPCGGRLIAKLGNLGKRRVHCESCRAREQARKAQLRLTRRLEQRFGVQMQRAAREERRGTRMINRLRRSGVR